MSAHHYNSAADALKDLNEAYNYWSGKLTESSVAFAFALIAANWAIYGSVGLKANLLPRLSVFLALSTLLVAAVTAQWMSIIHDRQHAYAEADPERWEQQFLQAKRDRSPNPWPYTKGIERVGFWSQFIRCAAPVVSCLLFLASFV